MFVFLGEVICCRSRIAAGSPVRRLRRQDDGLPVPRAAHAGLSRGAARRTRTPA